nr:hypothetical protein [uncultured Roseateles sp.]
MNREEKTTHSVAESLRPQVVAGNVNGQGVDTRGYDMATVLYTAGAIVASGDVTLKLQESDDNSSFSDVAAADLAGSFPSALTANSAGLVGYRGAKRYVRVVATLNSGTSVAASAAVLLGDPASTVGL